MFRRLRSASFNKKADLREDYNDDYRDKNGFVTPYHLLYKDHSNELASLNKEGAIERCLDLIKDYNEELSSNSDYYSPSGEELKEFLEFLQDENISNGMDVVFALKDFMLKDHEDDKSNTDEFSDDELDDDGFENKIEAVKRLRRLKRG